MNRRPFGLVAIAGVLLAAGLVGMAAFVRVVPHDAGTSPLAALLVLTWSSTCVVAAFLTWTRSRLAPFSLLAPIGLLVLPALFAFPGSRISVPLTAVLALAGYLGFHYLRSPLLSRGRG